MEYSDNRGSRYIPRISDLDNPFRAVPVDAMPEMLTKHGSCSFIAGMPMHNYPTFLQFVRKAFSDAEPYVTCNCHDGMLVVYDNLSWSGDNEDAKRLLDYLRLLGSLNVPVAYAMLGDGIEAYSNLLGYAEYRGKISWNPAKQKMDIASNFGPCTEPYSRLVSDNDMY